LIVSVYIYAIINAALHISCIAVPIGTIAHPVWNGGIKYQIIEVNNKLHNQKNALQKKKEKKNFKNIKLK
jgi:hypothetical protein